MCEYSIDCTYTSDYKIFLMKKTKKERFEMRMEADIKDQLTIAAEKAGYDSLAEYLTDTGVRRANDMGVYQKVRTHKDQTDMFQD